MKYENKVVESIKLSGKHPYQPNLYDDVEVEIGNSYVIEEILE